MKRVLVLGPSPYGQPFVEMGTAVVHCATSNVHHDVSRFECVVFTGGEDVPPEVYGHPRHNKSSLPDWKRTEAEQEVFEDCAANAVPMVGICRGSQFLNVMNGGVLVQHVENHTSNHAISTSSPEFNPIQVTSTHHQMMVPAEGAFLEAWANGLSPTYQMGGVEKPRFKLGYNNLIKEPEVVFYAATHSLCVQYHPEYMPKDSNGYKYFLHLLNKYIF